MENSTYSILEKARKLYKKYDHILSKDLELAYDSYTTSYISSWRKDCKQPEINLHKMISRVGGFPPALVRYFIAKFTQPGEVILDPFCGKGTSLLEAVRLGRIAIGGDIAPDAVIITKAKCNPPTIAKAINYVQEIRSDRKVCLSEVPDDVSIFYSTKTLKQILSIREFLLDEMRSDNIERQNNANFICAILLGILHGKSSKCLSLPCNHSFAMSPGYVRNYVKEHNLIKPERDVKECLIKKILEVLPAPKNIAHSAIYEMSAKDCNNYINESNKKANLIITSPPYLDRQTYLRDSWLRLWFIKRDWRELKKTSLETGNIRIFIEGMKEVMISLWNSLHTKGKIVLVCGTAKVDIAGKTQPVRISDLCLLAADQIRDQGYIFNIENIIKDKLLMKRGTYFAVIHGKSDNGNNHSSKRYGEDEILILSKKRGRINKQG
jgi:site-specific DNA-methyltransferase (adenine-specific)